MNDDAFDLDRFVDAQAGVYEDVVAELKAARKRSHWMWFIFPQIAGLGHSAMAKHYSIGSLDEAIAYGNHPLLGMRLRECTALMNAVENSSAHEVLGSPDDMKFRSSMTLFHAAFPEDALFDAALRNFFDRQPDERTLELLKQQ